MSSESNTYCKNCETELNGNFCENCGQRASVDKVTFKETFQDFMDMVFSVNAPLILTLKMLIINPGKLFREYLSGKRKKYYKPVAFLILATIVFVLVKTLLNYNPMDGIAKVEGFDSVIMNLVNEASQFFARNGNNIVFIFAFTLSISLKLFFLKRYFWSEYMAISFYIIGSYILMTSVIIFYLKFFNPELRMIPLVIFILYVLYAITSFFKTRNIWVVIKVLLVYVFSMLLYIIFGFGLSFLIVWLKTI